MSNPLTAFQSFPITSQQLDSNILPAIASQITHRISLWLYKRLSYHPLTGPLALRRTQRTCISCTPGSTFGSPTSPPHPIAVLPDPVWPVQPEHRHMERQSERIERLVTFVDDASHTLFEQRPRQ
ncbi:MAG: hypothetical protein Q9206_005223 [Seirophora lacunosa]